MNKLDEIGIKNGTDKSSLIHNYLNKYEKYLPFKQSDKLKFLEIGVLHGESLRMWKEYFYDSEIIGIDLNPDSKKHEEFRISIEVGSQFDSEFLSYVGDKHGPFDLILDDGSHVNEHVIFSFQNLFSRLKSGGVYIVEDVATSYWEEWGGGYKKQNSTVEYFKNLCDDVNFYGIINFNKHNVHARREDWCIENIMTNKPECIIDIESINFLNGLILITKR
jgi:SAM-dependent methyltransferase